MAADTTEFTRRRLLAAASAAPLALGASRALGQEAHGTPLAGNFALPDPSVVRAWLRGLALRST